LWVNAREQAGCAVLTEAKILLSCAAFACIGPAIRGAQTAAQVSVDHADDFVDLVTCHFWLAEALDERGAFERVDGLREGLSERSGGQKQQVGLRKQVTA
jgi:hypothetical protein